MRRRGDLRAGWEMIVRRAGSPSHAVLFCAALLLASPAWVQGAELAAPTHVKVTDHPNDAGTQLDISWTRSSDDPQEIAARKVISYRVLRRAVTADAVLDNPLITEFETIGEATAGVASYTDTNCKPGQGYQYAVQAVGKGEVLSTPAFAAVGVAAVVQWLDFSRLGLAFLLLLICGGIIGYIFIARSGQKLTLRTIPALQAVDEAVGRATEMGKSCLFVPGIQDINEMMTVAGIIVLGRVARTAAEYQCRVEVPTARSLVMTACRETVQAACYAAGRPEAYNADDISYIADEQFAFVAGVTGRMVREKPAACFYFGQFFAESLFLAETGNAIGALQIAGTAETTQLPFFVAACDYTLIGEEFFAASAYLSGEPDQLGSVKGQDIGKLLAGGLILLGVALATIISIWPKSDAGMVLRLLKTGLLGGG